jgi:hypothetical protein
MREWENIAALSKQVQTVSSTFRQAEALSRVVLPFQHQAEALSRTYAPFARQAAVISQTLAPLQQQAEAFSRAFAPIARQAEALSRSLAPMLRLGEAISSVYGPVLNQTRLFQLQGIQMQQLQRLFQSSSLPAGTEGKNRLSHHPRESTGESEERPDVSLMNDCSGVSIPATRETDDPLEFAEALVQRLDATPRPGGQFRPLEVSALPCASLDYVPRSARTPGRPSLASRLGAPSHG